MEDGGLPLFDFVNKAHKFIENGLITISEWHSISKVIFSSMIQSIEWLHECNVCHFDISLENFLINDVPVQRKENIENKEVQIKFIHDDIQLKLCGMTIVICYMYHLFHLYDHAKILRLSIQFSVHT